VHTDPTVAIEIRNEIQGRSVFTENFERRTMKMNCDAAERHGAGWMLVICWLAFTMPVLGAEAQSSDTNSSNAKPNAEIYETIHLNNLKQQNDLGEVQACLRSLLPKITIYSSPSQPVLSIRGSTEDVALAEKIIAEFDKPRATYRLTFTISGADGVQNAAAQTFSVLAGLGEEIEFNQERRILTVSGSSRTTQVQDSNVKLSIEATVDGFNQRLRLHSKVERSIISEEKSSVGTQDPIVKLAVLTRATILGLGKAQVLGNIDILGNGDRQEVSVVAERVN
jgi:hypothetical protein